MNDTLQKYSSHPTSSQKIKLTKHIHKSTILQWVIAALVAGASMTASAALPFVQPVLVNGVQADSGGRGVGMSRSGRYILIPSSGNVSDNFRSAFMFDLKTQSASRLPDPGSFADAYAISPNGRYVSYDLFTKKGNVFDQVTNFNFNLPATDENRALSNNGFAATRDQLQQFRADSGFSDNFVLINLKDQTAQKIDATLLGLTVSSIARHDWFSADGKTILLETHQGSSISTSGYQIYNSDTKQLTAFNPLRSNPERTPIVIRQNDPQGGRANGSSTIALSSNGKFIAFTALSDAEQNIWSATLLPSGGHTLRQFDLMNLFVTVEDGISISSNGRFVSFRGKLQPNHSEFADAQVLNLGGESFYRIFRYDTIDHKVETISIAKNGGPIRNRFNTTSGAAKIQAVTVISDDGSTIEFSTDADNMTSTIINTQGKMNKYYAYLSNGFTRNFQFVDMPNSDTNFLPSAPLITPMTLVGNNQWEGTITFDGIGTETFKFDVGGKLDANIPVATPNGATTFGAGITANQAKLGGSNIFVSGGAGDYKVTFNDQTLQYTVTKQGTTNGNFERTVVFIFGETQTGQDMFIRGGLDHAQAKARLGLNCDINNALCSMPIRHLNFFNATTAPWKQGDSKLDWQGAELIQGAGAQGSPLDWTTSFWPASFGIKRTVAIDGFGETPLNLWGNHYWMLDVEMDCSKTFNGWFEVKSFISNGPGWENNITQPGAPWASNNHFAQCGKLNVFKRGQNDPVTIGTL